MNFEAIFNDGLDEILCVIRDLPNYSAKKLKQEEYKAAQYDIDYILFRFQDYIKGLPAPGVSLSPSDRILIYNARSILEGISVVFNVQIDYIQRLYSNYLKYREKQLVPDPINKADIRKPKAKTGRTMKVLDISNVTETDHPEIPMIRDAGPDSSFTDLAAPVPPSSVDGAALFERDSQLLSSLADASKLPEDLELRLSHSLKDVTPRLPSESALDIGQPDTSLLMAPLPHQQLGKVSLALSEQPKDMEVSTVQRPVVIPSYDPLREKLEKILDNIGVVPDKVKPKRKNVKYKYRPRPIMTTEEYRKWLGRKRRYVDPVEYYSKKDKKSSEERQEKDTRFSEFPFLEHYIKNSAPFKIPRPIMPTYLRYLPRIQCDSMGRIPLFDFPILEDSDDDESPQRRRFYGNFLREGFEQRFHILPSADSRAEESVRPASRVDEIRNISLRMSTLSLDFTSRPSMQQHFEEAPLPPNLEDIQPTPFPQIREDNGGENVYTGGVPLSLDELLLKITDVCAQKDTTVIRFTELCDISKTKLEAAKVFVNLIELWKEKLVSLHQTSPHPSDIFMTMTR